MPITNRDASLTTARRRQLAYFAFRNNVTEVRREQPYGAGPSAEVPVQRYVGAQVVGQTANSCACTPAVTLQGYDQKSPVCS